MKTTSRSITKNNRINLKKYKGFRKKPFFCAVEFGFKRKNHLKSKRIIDAVFLTGKALNKPPFRLVFLEIEKSDFIGIQVLISVPKKRFKLAVSRNRVRRLIAEAYRLHSTSLQEDTVAAKKHVAFAIIYMGKKELSYSVIKKTMIEILDDLSSKLKN